METDHLRTAIALLRHGTVNRTAAEQGLAPSSISDRVRRLEAELGTVLFIRDRAGTRPTAAGRSYLAAAAVALDALDKAAEQLRTTPDLAVGAQASIAVVLLPEVLEDLRRAHPDLIVHVRPDTDRERLLRSLEHRESDAVVILDSGDRIGDLGFASPSTELEYLDLREVAMTVVVPPGHPLLDGEATMTGIRSAGGLIGREPLCSFWMATRRWLGPDVDLAAVGGLAQVREWVAAGRGIALLPEFAVRADLDSGRLAALDIRPPPLLLRLIWRVSQDDAGPLRRLLYALTQT